MAAFPALDTLRSVADLADKQRGVRSEIVEIDKEFEGLPLPEEQQAKLRDLQEEDEEITRRVTELEARAALVAKFAAEKPENRSEGYSAPTIHRKPSEADLYRTDDLMSMGAVRAPGVAIERALRIVERVVPAHPAAKTDKVRERLEELVRNDPKGLIAQRIVAVASPTYDRAFGKMVVGQSHALTNEERAVLNIGDSALPAPLTVDPTLMLTNAGASNPLRAISRVVTITGNEWRGVASDGIEASYDAELAEVSDDTPSLDDPTIHVEKAQAYIEYSIEAGEDWPNFRGEMARAFEDGKNRLEADKFMNGAGHGSDEPEGLLTGATNTITTISSNAFVIGDLFALTAALPDRYQDNATILAHRAILAQAAQFSTLASVSQGPLTDLVGYPVRAASSLESDLSNDPNAIAVVGDFSRFVIVDRVGLNVELIPLVYGTNRPVGKRALYAYWRNSSGVVDANAFVVLTIKA